ncbi:peptidase C45 [Alcaligenaceae bacterium]|nr:peptidase C45 [Alcaligenaceae bacterium]
MLSLIELSGTPLQIGKALGKFGAQAAHSYLVHSPSWASVTAWRGSTAAQAMQTQVEQQFPHIHQELQGLAAGLELPFEDVFLWNCRGDVWAMAPDGCTTVQLPLAAGPRITHNEDGDPGFAGYCGIGQFAPDSGPRFTSFLYPASIPGHTFAVNEHGLAMTVNNLRSRQVSAGVPRMVLTRALLNQAGLAQAIELLRQSPRAGGFHLSLAQCGYPDLLSVEFNAMGLSVLDIKVPTLHANHITHATMQDLPQVITDSSRHRQERGNALLSAADSPDSIEPLSILVDQADKSFPIYRDAPDDSDAENTMATADIRVGAEQVMWDIYERPGQSARFKLVNTELV